MLDWFDFFPEELEGRALSEIYKLLIKEWVRTFNAPGSRSRDQILDIPRLNLNLNCLFLGLVS